MQVMGFLVGVLTVAILALTVVIRIILWALRRKPRRYWRRAGLLNLLLVPVTAFVLVPGFFGFMGSRRALQTRGDESGYEGPRLAADGTWVLQSQKSLREEREGNREVAADVRKVARGHAVRFAAADGVSLSGYLVEPREVPARLQVVLVHGLFRGALELETVGSWFRDLGARVLLLEMRNHGHSGRAPATFGPHEARDVLAGVELLRSHAEEPELPLVLFGISLGTSAVSFAAPEVDDLRGLVLDAPMASLLDTAHRYLGGREGKPGIPQPFRTITFFAMGLFSGIDLAEVRPVDSLTRLPASLPALIIGGEEDQIMPVDGVREVFEALPASGGVKELWICPEARHGRVGETDPDGYRARLASLVERALEPPL